MTVEPAACMLPQDERRGAQPSETGSDGRLCFTCSRSLHAFHRAAKTAALFSIEFGFLRVRSISLHLQQEASVLWPGYACWNPKALQALHLRYVISSAASTSTAPFLSSVPSSVHGGWLRLHLAVFLPGPEHRANVQRDCRQHDAAPDSARDRKSVV